MQAGSSNGPASADEHTTDGGGGDEECDHGGQSTVTAVSQPGRNMGEHEFADLDAMSPLEPDPGLMGTVLEVDDDLNETGSIYAASQYPIIPTRYQVGRFDSATINSSRSLYVEDLDYVIENGRRYCGDCFFPNDDLEQDRLRVVHQVFLNIFDFELTSIRLHNPRYILDVGTGTGEWAIGMGEAYPHCEVVGVDISAIQPTAVPHNVFFEVDDCEIDWMRPDDSVDLVHLRDMAGAFSDWDFIYCQAFACLKPGGHIEILDFHDHTSENAFFTFFPPNAQIHTFFRAVDEASIQAGRRRGIHHMSPERLRRAGFVDIRISERAIPLNPLNDAISKLWLISCLHGVEATSLRLLTKHLGWEPARAFSACEKVCEEIKSHALNLDANNTPRVCLRILTARKPSPPDLPFSGPMATTAEYSNFSSAENSADESTING
ncbi:methyltransferase type 12 [Grosmannia clavigera kw1407]|uniref:Methyltransferase type 12 n=1 Tax=Grosmannia clavigera (strain kw1407 / UAMH 11150) TaxID=655863 RepID=F0XHL2_GROCL|nr:methyltransferase type 12 [Grosmannia clavigera kw1407]EFX03285.1 methyltransferase type 12 [Grosmannia clavigera kw1407]